MLTQPNMNSQGEKGFFVMVATETEQMSAQGKGSFLALPLCFLFIFI